MASQVERIKAMLRNGPVCSFADLYAAGMPNGRNRIGELRRQGWEIESRQCERGHPEGTVAHVEYVFVPPLILYPYSYSAGWDID